MSISAGQRSAIRVMATPAAIVASLLTVAGPVSPAHAAYAPVLTVQVDPTTASAIPTITTTVTQAAGETASRTVRVDFPRGYSGNLTETLQTCSADQEKQNTCPDGSRMGTATAQASVLGLPQTLSGNVYFGGSTSAGFKIIVYLTNALLGTQTLEGFSSFRDDGSVETVFDNLPNVLTTSFQLHLENGTRSLLVNPASCGNYSFSAQFTSQNGETATSSAPLSITGCQPIPPPPPAPPVISALSVRPARVRAGRTAALRFTLDAPAAVRITITRLDRRSRRRHLSVRGVTGVNHLNNVAARLPPGRYRIRATTGGDSPSSSSAVLTVRRRHR